MGQIQITSDNSSLSVEANGTYEAVILKGRNFHDGAKSELLDSLPVFAGVINLKSSKTNRNKFERNQVDEFVVEAVDIGELRKIKCVLDFHTF